MTLELRPVTQDAIDYVLAHLSAADRAEMQASGLQDPPEVFATAAAEAPIAHAVYLDGEPVAILGCNAGPVEGIGIPWMIGTDKAAQTGVAGAVLSRRTVAQMRHRFTHLTNWVHCEHRRAIRWLKWLGFRVKQHPVGPNGAFLEFEMEGVNDV